MKESYIRPTSAVRMMLVLIVTAELMAAQYPDAKVLPQTTVQADSANERDSNGGMLTANGVDPRNETRLRDSFGKLPLAFEANLGQVDRRVKFVSRGSGASIFLTANEAVLAVKRRNSAERKKGRPATNFGVVRMKLMSADSRSSAEGLDQLPGNSNYFIGKDPNKWRTDIPTYARVQYRDIYPGVNLIYYGNQRQLEYDFVLAPGAYPNVIKVDFQGTRGVRIDKDGDLVLKINGGNLRMHRPDVYQTVDEARQFIAGRYVLKGKNRVGFEIGAYDKSKTLIIDPVFSYSTFLGGTGFDEGRSIAVDSTGNAYVTGRTTSFNFPVTLDAYDSTYANSYDVFITKLNASGTALIYSTYLGGNDEDQGYGLAIDPSGNAFLTGSTSSNDYPITPGAFQSVRQGGSFPGDAFVTKLDSTGTTLIYSTYLGGFSSDQGNAIVFDSSGNAYVAGYTNSSNFPKTPTAFQAFYAGGGDAFITEMNSTGTAVPFSTFLGGTGFEQVTSISIDSQRNTYLTGSTNSVDFDVTPGAFQTVFGGTNFSSSGDVFATKLNSTGTALVYSTYLGGRNDDTGTGISIDAAGNAYIAGYTSSVNFPSTPGVVRVSNGGVSKTTNGGNSWAAINNGLTVPTIFALAVDPVDPTRIYAGTQSSTDTNGNPIGGVFRSTNSGASWTATNSGLTDLSVRTVTIDPTATTLIYLGTGNRGVFRSTDGGASWRAINTGQNGMGVNTLKIDPSISSTIYAGTNQGISKTTNGGANWASINSGIGTTNINALAIDPSTTSNIYAGLSFNGVFKSTNGGANWTATTLTNANIRALAVDPAVPLTVYAAGDSGVFKSTNGGASWASINTGLTDRTVSVLMLSPADSNAIVVGTANGVFTSTNGGAVWSALNSGLAGAVINTLVFDPLNAQNLYAGASVGGTDAFITKVNPAGTALVYSTFLGGSGSDQASAIATDASGTSFITGLTTSANFPTTPGVFQTLASSFDGDAFVTKLGPAGSALVYSTFLGGNSTDRGNGIAVDSNGSAYVTGQTRSSNFPITPDAFQPVLSSFSEDAFISKLTVTPILNSDLRISMSASPPSGIAGSGISYIITVTNDGPERASSVTVNDDLPPTAVFQNCSSNFGCTRNGNSVTFNISSLDVGSSTNMSISATVSCSINSSVAITNTATVTSLSIDSNTNNNSAMATTTANPATTALTPTSQDFPVNGGSSQVNVNRGGSNCPWTATSNASWITITFSSSFGNGVVSYTVASNSGAPRVGTMTIAGLTFTVNQAGSCAVSISPTAASYGAAGGMGTVNVTGPAACSWAAFTSFPWITITSGASGSGNGIVGYSVAANMTSANRIGSINIGGQTLIVVQTRPGGTSRTTFDFDGDAKTDISVWRPSNGTWFIINSTNGSIRTQGWGVSGDLIVPGDYDGDGTTDLAVWRPSNGIWFIVNSSNSSTRAQGWGQNGDTPVPGDYDGDGKTDLAIWRPSSGSWSILNSSNGTVTMTSWGTAGDVPVPADYDGDGKADIAVWRPSSGVWFIINSSNGSIRTQGWGVNADKPVPGDYDGDRKADLAVWRPSSGVWFIVNSSNGSNTTTGWGIGGDKPVPADYDGDGKVDIAVWRPSTGTWLIISSLNGSTSTVPWGVSDDIPTPTAFIGM